MLLSFRKLLPSLWAALTLSGTATAQRFEPLDPDLRNVRGVNYVPTYPPLDGTTALPWFGVASHTAMWAFFDATTAPHVERQLLWARRTGFNTVRVFLSYLCWQYHEEHRQPGQPNAFLTAWQQFLTMCEAQGLRVMPVLWDFVSLSQPYAEPDYDRRNRLASPANISFWHDNPGRKKAIEAYGQDFAVLDLGRYVVDCVRALDAHDPDLLLCWDVANEPYVGNDDELGLRSRWFVAETMALVKKTRKRDRVLVSAGVNDRFPTSVEWARDPNCDVIGIHVYGPNSRDLLEAFVHDATFVDSATAPLGKPVLATEIGNPGAGFSYPDTVRYCGDVPRPDLPGADARGVGFCTWMLMIGHSDQRPGRWIDDRHPFKHGTGLFYGHLHNGNVMVRDLDAVRAFVDLAVRQGQDPRRLWFGDQDELAAIGVLPPAHPYFVDPLRGGQVRYFLSQRWVLDWILRSSRGEFENPALGWADWLEVATLLRETVHPNLDLQRTVSLGNGNRFRSTTAACYRLGGPLLDKLEWFRAASLPGSPEFATMLQQIEAEHDLPRGSMRPWDAGHPQQRRDLRLVFGEFLHPFATTLAPILLPR